MSLRTQKHEELSELLIRSIVVERRSALWSLQDLMGGYLETDVDTVILAATMTASALEEWYKDDPSVLLAASELWKLTSVLACDLIEVRYSGISNPTVEQIVRFWLESNDTLFLPDP